MKKQTRIKKLHIVLILLLVTAVGLIGAQGIRAKYVTTVSVQGNVSFSANLAESMSLYEHKANRLTDGSYELTEDKVGTVIDPGTGNLTDDLGNEYQVMPGVDIPKDPQIAIQGKSALDSYLYVEIADSLQMSNASDEVKSTIQYQLTDNWKKLDGVTGPNGTSLNPTSVYVYTKGGTAPKVFDETFADTSDDTTIKILEDDIVTVGENYASADFVMNIYAYMLQIPQNAAADPAAEDIFAAQYPAKAMMLMSRAKSMLSAAGGEDEENAADMSLDDDVAVVADDDTEPEYVTITIQYLDEESQVKVFDDYVATLRYNTEFSANVDSPTRVGYAPYIDDVLTETVKIPKQNYVENVVYTVEYKPIEVSYTVRHYIQNASDDSYMEYKMVTGKLLTGSKPTTEELALPELVDDKDTVGGFESLYHEPDTVAADGSTEFHVYYNRKYFLYTFDCDGGYGVDPIYARYETPLAVPTPVKPGYDFTGWQVKDANGNWIDAEVDEKVGLSDVSYRATWKAKPTGSSYTIIYWLESPEPDEDGKPKKYEYWGSETVKNAEAGKPASGSDRAKTLGLQDYQYAVFDADATDENVEIKGDGSTVVNVYYNRRTYTLKFYYAKEENGKYYVCGNTTNFANGSGVANQLSNVSGNWSQVKALPTLTSTDTIDVSIYGQGSDEYTVNGTKGNYYYVLLTGKYDADISNQWPVGVFTSAELSASGNYGDYAYFSAWNVDSESLYDHENGNKTLKGNYQRLDAKMLIKDNPNRTTIYFLGFWENATKTINWNKPHRWTYRNYVPVLDGETADHTYNGMGYKLHSTFTLYDNNGYDAPEQQTATGLEGYENFAREAFNDGVINSTHNLHAYSINFYYRRNQHTFSLTNYDEVINTWDDIVFGQKLSGYEVKNPQYPDNLESNAYYFEGWYTSAECAEGTKVDWSTLTMPDGDFMLYANWLPIQRTITFSNHYQDAVDGNYLTGFGGTIAHGQNMVENGIPIPSIDPEDGQISAEGIGNATNYTPVGWFYVDPVTGDKKRFEPGTMKVTSDLHLFMEWRSNKVVPYTIEFYKDNENGTYTKIAEDLTGYSFAGLTRTFKAKVADELYVGYQTRHYPMESSHSILMVENGTNTFRFLYYYKEAVKYKINYINQLTKLPMEFTDPSVENPFIGTTSDAVITKKFVPESGYMPDAFYKRLVLSYPDENNIINFYYTQDTEHAYYAVKHMIEIFDGVYEEYAYTQGVGDIGNTVTADALPIGGYEYDQTKTAAMITGTSYTADASGVSGTITLEGLEMVIYYKKAPSGYVIRYVEYGADIDVDPDLKRSQTVTGKYGDPISITVLETLSIKDTNTNEYITYILYGDKTYTSTMGIITYDGNGDPIYPQIIFYYTAKQVQISYEAICKTGTKDFGWVDIANERAATASGLSGCTATAEKGYKFVGWYSEKECENLITTDAHYKPTALPSEDTTYYALFEPILSQMTIKKEGTGISDTDTFLFRVKGKKGGTANIDLIVTITGKESVTITNLPIGTYTVTELTDWSWRYEGVGEVSREEDVSEITADNVVIFNNTKETTSWLGGEKIKVNEFEAK